MLTGIMKRKLKKRSSTKADVVYDDDTDSSDSDELQSFRKNFKSQQKGKARKYSSSDADDEVNENTSDDDDTSESQSNASRDDDISSEEEDEIEEIDDNNEKLQKLQNQLKSLDKVSVSVGPISEMNEEETQISNEAMSKGDFKAQSVSKSTNFSNKQSTDEPSIGQDKERVITKYSIIFQFQPQNP